MSGKELKIEKYEKIVRPTILLRLEQASNGDYYLTPRFRFIVEVDEEFTLSTGLVICTEEYLSDRFTLEPENITAVAEIIRERIENPPETKSRRVMQLFNELFERLKGLNLKISIDHDC